MCIMEQTSESPLAPGPAPQQTQETGITPPRSLFADPPSTIPSVTTAPAAPPALTKSSTAKRVVLPLIILLVAIGVIAWVTQYRPGVAPKGIDPKQGNVQAAIRFVSEVSTWEHDPDFIPGLGGQYVKMIEFGTNGHYDYVFENTTDGEAEIGVHFVSCACSSVEICVLNSSQEEACRKALADRKPPLALVNGVTWQKVEVDDKMAKSLKVPAKSTGVLRLHWKSPVGNVEVAQQALLLTIKAWSRGTGPAHNKVPVDLAARVLYVRPALFEPEELKLGILGPKQERSESFICWSGTRELQLASASTDPHIKVRTEPLSLRRYRDWTRTIPTKVYCAFRVTVTLHEQADGKQLDLGFIRMAVPVKISNTAGSDVTFKTPMLEASVSGVVRLADPSNKISLDPFPANKGTQSKEVFVYAPKGCTLRCDVEQLPGLSATIRKVDDVGNNETRWALIVTVSPHGVAAGQLPDDAVVVLRVEYDNAQSPPRAVRIRISGTAFADQR
jgi:hypothetical protein